LWKVEEDGDGQKVDYLATLSKHTQAVYVVRWAPKGEPTPPRQATLGYFD
jgi:chromatin assembly factor 1 subunit B